jgi:hypothetical protein
MRAHFVLPILAVLSFTTAVLAGPPANTVMKATPPVADPRAATRECVHNYELQVARTGMLEVMLNITPQQKPVFDAWKKVRLTQWKAVPCPSPPMGLDVPVPQRLANQITMMSATLDGLREEQPATDALYKILTPEQRALFDGPVKMAVPAPAPGVKPAAPPATH